MQSQTYLSLHQQAKMKSQRNVTYNKNIKNKTR